MTSEWRCPDAHMAVATTLQQARICQMRVNMRLPHLWTLATPRVRIEHDFNRSASQLCTSRDLTKITPQHHTHPPRYVSARYRDSTSGRLDSALETSFTGFPPPTCTSRLVCPMAGEERHPQHLAVGERASLLRRESSASYPSESHHQEEYILRRERDLSPTSTVGSHHEWDSGQWKTIGVLLMGMPFGLLVSGVADV